MNHITSSQATASSVLPAQDPSILIPIHLVAEVQDALVMAMTDLQRLEGLLDHATGNLLDRFSSANRALTHLVSESTCDDGESIHLIREDLRQAVTELQFHDMSTQLIAHTGKILQGCASRLADSAMPSEEGEIAVQADLIPDRPSPVTQNEMDAGSIDLF